VPGLLAVLASGVLAAVAGGHVRIWQLRHVATS
jgi:hypothetical protein